METELPFSFAEVYLLTEGLIQVLARW